MDVSNQSRMEHLDVVVTNMDASSTIISDGLSGQLSERYLPFSGDLKCAILASWSLAKTLSREIE